MTRNSNGAFQSKWKERLVIVVIRWNWSRFISTIQQIGWKAKEGKTRKYFISFKCSKPNWADRSCIFNLHTCIQTLPHCLHQISASVFSKFPFRKYCRQRGTGDCRSNYACTFSSVTMVLVIYAPLFFGSFIATHAVRCLSTLKTDVCRLATRDHEKWHSGVTSLRQVVKLLQEIALIRLPAMRQFRG